MRRFLLLVSALALGGCRDSLEPTPARVDPKAALQVSYEFVDLGNLGGDMLAPNAINGLGDVAGTSLNAAGERRAFLWSNGVMQDLGTVGGSSSEATGINDRGDVVGFSVSAAGESHVFLWTGSMRDLGPGGGTSRAVGATAAGAAPFINSRDQVAFTLRVGSGFHAAFWDGSTVIDLGTLGGAWSEPTGLNNQGQMAGWSYTDGFTHSHAFTWAGGLMRDLGAPANGSSRAESINEPGDVAGVISDQSFVPHAVSWSADGQVTDLGVPTGSHASTAFANNNGGLIAGNLLDANTDPARPFVWLEGTLTPLPRPSPTTSQIRGNVLNSAGHVAGTYFANNNSITPGAFVWDGTAVWDLNTLTGGQSEATAINQHGDVVGVWWVRGQAFRGALWRRVVQSPPSPVAMGDQPRHQETGR